jgi:hypothetical protein
LGHNTEGGCTEIANFATLGHSALNTDKQWADCVMWIDSAFVYDPKASLRPVDCTTFEQVSEAEICTVSANNCPTENPTDYCKKADPSGKDTATACHPFRSKDVTTTSDGIVTTVRRHTIPWTSDARGTPANFVLEQHQGKVYFLFHDHSQCEDGFAFARDGNAFVGNLDFAGAKACGEHIVRNNDVYDDLFMGGTGAGGERVVNEQMKYCVSAVSTIGVGALGYVSDTKCKHTMQHDPTKVEQETFRVAYEAKIVGSVLTKKAKVPVDNVLITARLYDGNSHSTTETCTPPACYKTTTDSNGQFNLPFD